MFHSFDISASGLTAQRVRMDTIASNIANIDTPFTKNGVGYRRLFTVFQAQRNSSGQAGVRVTKIEQDQSPLKARYQPWSPDADKGGYVYYPNVDLATENVNAMEASRAYSANVTAIQTTKAMISATLAILA
jgi:flagellar basal-body rod protein FlgC